MSYQSPVQDLMFRIEQLSHREMLSALEVYSECELPDIGAARPNCATEQARILQGAQRLLDAEFAD